jgi:acyl transferase domain-containing protein
LAAVARRHRDWLAGSGRSLPLTDVCYTAGARRTHHEHRLAVACRSHEDLIAGLDGFLAGETRVGLVSGRRPAEYAGRVVFVFPGQGSQWLGMGRQLFQRVPAFRAALEACDHAARATAGWSILDEIHADPDRSRLDDISVIQPTLFAMQVSLAALARLGHRAGGHRRTQHGRGGGRHTSRACCLSRMLHESSADAAHS